MSRNLHVPGSCNPSANPSFDDVLVSRRALLKAGLAATALSALPGCASQGTRPQHAVGVSVIEVSLENNQWGVIRPSKYARRITARTPCRVGGPAAGHPLMRTADDPGGTIVRGTYAGCAHGWTPWGTYLTCEENW